MSDTIYMNPNPTTTTPPQPTTPSDTTNSGGMKRVREKIVRQDGVTYVPIKKNRE